MFRLWSVSFVNGTTGTAVGDLGTIVHTTTGGVDPVLEPDVYTLSQNYPNPFNVSTAIRFHIPMQSSVTLKIYDLLGQEVETLITETLDRGTHTRIWNAQRFASGMYIYRLETSGYEKAKKLMLLR